MKSFKFIVAIIALVSCLQMNGQQKVALQHNGTASFFGGNSPFVDAYNAATAGDTIYLHGGEFTAPNVISKQLVVFGNGHHPDSTAVSGETIMNGFTISAGGAKSHFEGLKTTSGITFNGIADSVVLKRCYINGSISLSKYASKDCQIVENIIIGSISGTEAIKTVIANNIIKPGTKYMLTSLKNQTWIYNNILVSRGYSSNYVNYYILVDITDCLFENNIILNEGTLALTMTTCANNTFRNNLFNGNPSDLTNTWENNFFDIASNSIFTNYTALIFDYTENFHLLNPPAYTGTTGNEIGVYGGYNPIKEGAVPSNPHIRNKSISTQTNASGEINVSISVSAQDN